MLLSPISPTDSRGELIREASVIIWDEGPMVNRAVLACVNEVCQTVMENDQPFGKKIVIILGDFRQTCPVIRGGTRAQVVDASIKSSSLWELFTIYRLTIPIRNAEDPEFADFVDAIGEGAGPDVPLTLIQHVQTPDDLIDFVYPPNILPDPLACLQRAILAPTHIQVDAYNKNILRRVQGETRTYLSADTLKEADDVGLEQPDSVLDYVAQHTPPGFPHHSLEIKTNAIFRLLRNFSIDLGLVKNIRVVIVNTGSRLITVRILRGIGGANAIESEDILIPRISFQTTLHSGHTLHRKQFPLAPAYATTFNSCQGLTLNCVGIDLTRPVFSHGQLYTALSRVRHRSHARVHLRPGETATTNVTYHELLI